MPRLLRQRVEGKHEDHHHQQGKKQHRIERVFRAPLQANVLDHRRLDHRPERIHWTSPAEPPLRARLAVRSTICPACIQTNSSARPSSSSAWCVITKMVFPEFRIPWSSPTMSFAEGT